MKSTLNFDWRAEGETEMVEKAKIDKENLNKNELKQMIKNICSFGIDSWNNSHHVLKYRL